VDGDPADVPQACYTPLDDAAADPASAAAYPVPPTRHPAFATSDAFPDASPDAPGQDPSAHPDASVHALASARLGLDAQALDKSVFPVSGSRAAVKARQAAV
jgi:hypothetical protein